MSVLVHPCTHCGHRQDWHYQGSYVACPCCRVNRRESSFSPEPEPQLWETFAHPSGHPEPLYQPGTQRNPGNVNRSDVCGCDRCQELYAEMTA